MGRQRRGLGCGGLIFGWLLIIVVCITVLTTSIVNPKSPEVTEIAESTEEIEESTEEIEETQQETTEESEETEVEETEEPEQEEIVQEEIREPEEEETEAPAAGRMYKQLDAQQQELYMFMKKNIEQDNYKFRLEDIQSSPEKIWDVVHQAYSAFYYDYPEYFWLNSNWSGSAYTDGKGNYDVEFESLCYNYWQYVLDKESYINDVRNNAEAIAAEAATKSSIYDKIKYVHDYLVTNVVYDEVCLKELNQTNQRASNEQSHSAYGALVKGLAVCDGYAKAFQLIMNMLDIECEYIEGYAGEYHAWNYLNLDGANYWMDVTWDDYNLKNKDGSMLCPEGVTYDYYCITSENLYRTHEPDDTFQIPTCTATEYNFFHREGAYFDEYSFEGVCNAMNHQKEEQMISVQFGTSGEYEEAMDDIFRKNNRYFDIPYFSELEGQFINNNQQYSITFIYPNN